MLKIDKVFLGGAKRKCQFKKPKLNEVKAHGIDIFESPTFPIENTFTFKSAKENVNILVETANSTSCKVYNNGVEILALESGLSNLVPLLDKSKPVTVVGEEVKTVILSTNNQIDFLDVRGLSSLKVLDCSKTSLKELRLEGLKKLEDLYCHNNQLTALDLKESTELT